MTVCPWSDSFRLTDCPYLQQEISGKVFNSISDKGFVNSEQTI